ncbi:MAG: hypothetical protein QOC80_139, partial [Frankiaceae bacterium]|nr:hypothetical protein [Frankiaceae bacterium]
PYARFGFSRSGNCTWGGRNDRLRGAGRDVGRTTGQSFRREHRSLRILRYDCGPEHEGCGHPNSYRRRPCRHVVANRNSRNR